MIAPTNSMLPNRFMAATEKVKKIKSNSAATFIILGNEYYRVLRRCLKPLEAFIILSNLATLIILRAVIFTDKLEALIVANDSMTIRRSNKFYLLAT